jgi:hypothetical protein
MGSKSLRLTIDLVPETCWYSSLYRQIPQSKWKKLRKQACAEAGDACQICGAKGRLNCHEVWEFDDKTFTQKLKGFVALCSMCHHIKHFGMFQILVGKGQLDLDAVIDHFCKVNNVSRKVFGAHKTQAFDVWRERSQHQWEADLGKWREFIAPKTA